MFYDHFHIAGLCAFLSSQGSPWFSSLEADNLSMETPIICHVGLPKCYPITVVTMICHCILQLHVFVCSYMSLSLFFSKQQLWGKMWHPAADKVPVNKQSNEQTSLSHSELSRKKEASESAHMELEWRAKEKLRKDIHSNNRKHCNSLFPGAEMYLLLFYFSYVPLCTQWLKPPAARKPTL